MKLVKERASQGYVSVADLEKVASALAAATSTPLASLFETSEKSCFAQHEMEIIKRMRSDAFGRLLVHRFAPLLEDGTVARSLLPNFFSALKMILGDEELQRLQDQAVAVVADLKAEGSFSWDAFYATPAALDIVDAALVRIGRAFRRFDMRRDWFIKLMAHNPSSVSLGSNAFLPIKREAAAPFGEAEFFALMKALFADVRPGKIDARRQKAITDLFGEAPAKIFAPLFEGLAAHGPLD
ncbi:MAG: hypothetical protein HQL40_14765 [Alphaproteobacteria bacterium]|nr:hypothetical protein [Alphaproteobacteria bacterium]